MRLLDRYLFRELMIPFFLFLSGVLIFFIGVDLMNEFPRLQANRLTFLEGVEYYLFKLPELLSFVIAPVSLLIALLYTLTLLAKHHELTAMRAAGISLWRLSVPYLAVGFLVSTGLLTLNEYLAPNSNAMAQEILNRHANEQANADERHWHNGLNFSNDGEGRIWNIGRYNKVTSEMINPVVEWRAADKTVHRLFAKSAVLTNGVWIFYDVSKFIFEPPSYDVPRKVNTNELAMSEFNETPELIRSEIKISTMSRAMAAKRIRFTLDEILSYRRLHPKLDKDMKAMLDTQFHGRLAQPWTSLVVVLIAIPLGSLSGRRNVFIGVASSIFICFAYFLLAQLGLSLGTRGNLPPWLAAWLPNILFGVGGIFFIVRAR